MLASFITCYVSGYSYSVVFMYTTTSIMWFEIGMVLRSITLNLLYLLKQLNPCFHGEPTGLKLTFRS